MFDFIIRKIIQYNGTCTRILLMVLDYKKQNWCDNIRALGLKM